MLGHAVRLSRTNTNGVVWVCECGAIGDVVPMVGCKQKERGLTKRRIAVTESIALARHGAHLEQVRADVARASDAELARIGKMKRLADSTLLVRGRWGHP